MMKGLATIAATAGGKTLPQEELFKMKMCCVLFSFPLSFYFPLPSSVFSKCSVIP